MSKNRLTVKATHEGLAKAKMSLKRLHGTQLDLAKNLTGLVGRSTIQKFFKGEEVQVDKFKEICKALTLESQWEVIAGLTDSSNAVNLQDLQPPEQALEKQDSSINTDTLVKEVPEKEKLHIQLGSGNYKSLSGEQRRELQNALLDAFRDKSSLEQMLSFELNKNLSAIADGNSLQDIVFNLITKAESEGWISNLIYAARQSNPGNPSLKAIGLNWPQVEELEAKNFNINALVQEVREKVKPYIKERCGTMRVLDMTQPIGLNEIYTNVYILDKMTRYRRLEIDYLLQNFDIESDDFDHLGLSKITQKRISGLNTVEHHSKLIVLGKPGAGKTTFLKYLAIQCINGEFQSDRVPLFITLKEFAEIHSQPNLQEFIIQYLHKLHNNFLTNFQIFALLNHGIFLILLDGLDEVRKETHSRIISQIKEFYEQYYNNRFVITCRIAAREYTFEQFNEVEVSDFDNKQISEFVNKWFHAREDTVKAKHFIEKLQDNNSINELATNPLLLTLLCLVFEARAEFPTNRSELYKEGLDVLLKKWDAKRNIEREQVYRKLSLQRKEDLLSQIAFYYFDKKQYFFKQREVEEQIVNYIRNVLDVTTNETQLRLDGEDVLKSIEAQHGLLVERSRGIYSFSHLTFQEYFTAREIVYSFNQEKALNALANHITEKRWQEVFLITVGMLKEADYLLQLMKHKIDALLATDEKLQKFLNWINEKSRSVQTPYKLAAIRAFYFNLEYSLTRVRDRELNLSLAADFTLADLAFVCDLTLERDLALDRARDRDLIINRNLASNEIFALDPTLVNKRALARNRAHNVAQDHDFALAFARAFTFTLGLDRSDNDYDIPLAIDHDLVNDLLHTLTRILTREVDLAETFTHKLNLELQFRLQQLKEQLPKTSYENRKNFLHWLQIDSQAWTEQFKAIMIEYRNIGHDWQFDNLQWKLLLQYYDANKLLIACLKSDCYVSREVRQEIEDTLLLPVKQ